MKRLATLEQWARRLATREELVFVRDGQEWRGAVKDGPGGTFNRRLILALVEAYSTGYHDALKDTIRKPATRTIDDAIQLTVRTAPIARPRRVKGKHAVPK